jgi:translation initiation factor 2 subunit 3
MPLRADEQVLLNIGSTTTGSLISSLKGELARFQMVRPACCDIEERIAISRKINNHWRLIGYGKVCGGKIIKPNYSVPDDSGSTDISD